MQYAQIPIQLRLSTVSSPSVPPVDGNTGNAPQFFRGQPVAFNIGIFDASNNPVDITNLSSLQLALYASQTALYPLAVVNIPDSDPSWNDTITTAQWVASLLANATAIFTAGQTDQSLNGAASATYWMTASGTVAANGAVLMYGAGPVTIVNSASQVGILSAPAPTYSSQANGGGTTTITPTSLIHTAEIPISGSAGTRNFILSTVGYSALFTGAQVDVLLDFPAVPGIVCQFYDSSLIGINLAAFTSDGSGASQCVRFFYNGTQWKYKSSSP